MFGVRATSLKYCGHEILVDGIGVFPGRGDMEGCLKGCWGVRGTCTAGVPVVNNKV